MTILRSTGPVISTRRSWRSAGIGADAPVAAANARGLGKKVRPLAGGEPRLARAAALEQLVDSRPEAPREIFDERDRRRGEDAFRSLDAGPDGTNT